MKLSTGITIEESVKIALSSLSSAKLRTFLTLLGVIIGVMSVITVVSIIKGLDYYVETKLFNIGSNDFLVSKTPSIITSFKEWLKYRKRKDIKYEDFLFLRERCKNCRLIGARVSKTGNAKYRDNTLLDVSIKGFMPEDFYILGTTEIYSGRPLIEDDIKYRRRVVVIGWDLKEKLFGNINPLGKWIRVSNIPLRVVGIAEKKGKILGQSQDSFAVIPITLFFKKFGRNRSITISVHTESLTEMENAMDEVRLILRARRKLSPRDEDDFSIESQDTFLDFYKKTTMTMSLVMIIVASISLFVGGIVIMNIMLVSVAERMKEIGLRKAVGATRKNIMFQFLVESVTISSVGGAFGILLGFFIAKAITLFTGFPSRIELWSVVAGIMIAGLVGLFAGVYPASKASKLDPIVTLRM